MPAAHDGPVPTNYFDRDVAERYDDLDDPMFSPEVLGPTVDLLADLAESATAEEREGRLARWADDLHRGARAAFDHATGSLDSSARHLRALAQGARSLVHTRHLMQTTSTT